MKINLFLSHVLRIILLKNQVPRPKGVSCSPFTDRHTDRQTDRQTEGTLLGFQEFFLQPIIKKRPNICWQFSLIVPGSFLLDIGIVSSPIKLIISNDNQMHSNYISIIFSTYFQYCFKMNLKSDILCYLLAKLLMTHS